MAEVKVKFTSDASAFFSTVGRVRGAVGGLASVGKKIAGVVAGLTSLAGVAITLKGLKDAFEFGQGLSDLSLRTGGAISGLAVLNEAFRQAGVSTESIGPLLGKLQKSLAGINEDGENTSNVFSDLGLSVADLKTKDPTEQFRIVGEAIQALQNPIDRTAAAMKVFGKSGAQILQIFGTEDAIPLAAEFVGEQAKIFEETAHQFGRIGDVFSGLGVKFRGIFVGTIAPFVDDVQDLANIVSKIDLAPFGRKVGAHLKIAITVFRSALSDGTIPQLVGNVLSLGIATALNLLVAGLRAAFAFGTDQFFTSIRLLPNTLAASAQILAGVFNKVLAGFLGTFTDIISVGSALLTVGFQKALEVFNGLFDFFARVVAFFKASLQTAIQNVLSVLPDFLRPEGIQNRTFGENLTDALSNRGQSPIAGFQAQTLDEAIADQRNNAVPEFVKSISQIGDLHLAEGFTAFKTNIDASVENLKAAAERFTVADFFGAGEFKDKLSQTTGQVLGSAIASPTTASERSSQQQAVEKIGEVGTGLRKVEGGDEFSKIGLFAGGAAATGVLDHLRSTAQSTREMVEILKTGIRVRTGETAVAIAG